MFLQLRRTGIATLVVTSAPALAEESVSFWMGPLRCWFHLDANNVLHAAAEIAESEQDFPGLFKTVVHVGDCIRILSNNSSVWRWTLNNDYKTAIVLLPL